MSFDTDVVFSKSCMYFKGLMLQFTTQNEDLNALLGKGQIQNCNVPKPEQERQMKSYTDSAKKAYICDHLTCNNVGFPLVVYYTKTIIVFLITPVKYLATSIDFDFD